MHVTVEANPGPYDVLECDVGAVPDAAIAMMRDGNRQTLVVPAGTDIPYRRRERGWALIHLRAELPFDVVGFLAKYAAAWAKAGIPILAFASYHFDHVLVPGDRLDEAVAIAQAI